MDTINFDGMELYLTSPLRTVLATLEALHKPAAPGVDRMGVAIAAPGLGKTLAGRYFASKHHQDTVYIDLPPNLTMRSAGACFDLLERALGIGRSGRNSLQRLDRIVESLRTSPRMIILDTAHRLRYDQVDVFRYIHDASRVAVAILSVPKLRDLFDENAELRDRLLRYIEVPPPSIDEVRQLLPPVSSDVLGLIYQLTGGRIRGVLQLGRLITSSNRAPEKWTLKDVSRVSGSLTGEAA